jgi:hypothetical protein
MKPVCWAVVAALAALPAGAAAQDAASGVDLLSVGSRVRFTSSAIQGRMKGLVVALDGGTMTLAGDEGGVPLKVPVASITALEASVGKKRHWLRGMLIGGGIGLLVGITGPVDESYCGGESGNFCSREEAVIGGTLVSAGLGAGIGALFKTDRWAPVTLGATRSGSGGRRAAVVVTFRF